MSKNKTEESMCKFCGKNFSNIQNLKNHIKTAKYCLALRNENDTLEFTCEYCDQSLSHKSSLVRHQKSCLVYKDYMISSLEEKLKLQEQDIIVIVDDFEEKLKLQKGDFLAKLKEKDDIIIKLREEVSFEKGIVTGIDKGIDKAAAKPQIVVNKNNTNNSKNSTTNNGKIINKKLALVPITHIQPLTLEYVKSRVEEYDYDKYKNGRKGVSQFIENLILLNMDDGTTQKNMICTDRSRNAFHRLVQNKEWKSDAGATYLNTILNNLIDQALIHNQTLQDEIESKGGPGEKTDKLSRLDSYLQSTYIGITVPKSKDRTDLFESIRNDIRDKCAITQNG
jgi:hypothetical protein